MDPAAPPLSVAGAPIFVSSPSARCGTTLVQRLLNSSAEVLVFGEGVGAALVELTQSVASRSKSLARVEEHRRDLARALAGEQFWCPHLLGDAFGFVRLFVESLERFVLFHEGEARAHGRAVWGAKLPSVPVAALAAMRAVLPGSRIVYVVRDLAAAARSAKSRRFLRAPEDFERFARSWREGVTGIEELRGDPGVTVLDYARLERCEPEVLRELAAFAGVERLDPRVLGARVNTWEGAHELGHAPDQRLAPAELDREELASLERGAAMELPAAPL
ncbi:MAG: sulfotransferase [Planctomycetes bacterium]|nr:sulfotransferase [Planctomycetota bacterium]